ncbi:MAG: hypothetical protein JWR69_1695, partial [Pedosphaera sp.]|nr:hypothetical protein [Pedosphaera sp.]
MKSQSKAPVKLKRKPKSRRVLKYVPLNPRLFDYIGSCRSHAY